MKNIHPIYNIKVISNTMLQILYKLLTSNSSGVLNYLASDTCESVKFEFYLSLINNWLAWLRKVFFCNIDKNYKLCSRR